MTIVVSGATGMVGAGAVVNPRLTFCYVTGVGTDSSEQGRTS
jgi:hypothetical protein